MSWWIAPLIMGGVKLGIQALTKPKKYKTDLGYLDRYISNLRGDLGEKEIYHTMMRGALRNIGTQEAKTRKMMEYGAGKIGEPVRAQQLISLQQATSKAVTEAGEKAGLVQLQESRRIQSKIEEATMMKERIQEQIRERNRRMEESYRSEMIGTVAETGVNLATAGLQYGAEKQEIETTPEPKPIKAPKQDVVYYKGKPYDVKWNETEGGWETLAGDPIDVSKVTFEKPEEIKRGGIKTAFGPGGEKREYRMIGDVPTWLDTNKPIESEEWGKWDVDRPEKIKAFKVVNVEIKDGKKITSQKINGEWKIIKTEPYTKTITALNRMEMKLEEYELAVKNYNEIEDEMQKKLWIHEGKTVEGINAEIEVMRKWVDKFKKGGIDYFENLDEASQYFEGLE
ncbi:MAG: hypothetical protein H8D22_04370 [Candidatus Cloacimonetes bacterium]|nr:hypothetical protein [Candidatus Cloacimonadota bacterium]